MFLCPNHSMAVSLKKACEEEGVPTFHGMAQAEADGWVFMNKKIAFCPECTKKKFSVHEIKEMFRG